MSANMESVALSALTAHSNLAEVCKKYNISRSAVKCNEKKNLIQITNQIIKFNGKQGAGDIWSEAKQSVKNFLYAKMNENTQEEEVHVFVKNENGLLEAISNEIVKQLQRQHKNQGIWNRLFFGPVSDEFHYAEKFGTTDAEQGRADYLNITGSGRIECDLKIYEVRLNIELHIRVVTVKCDEIACDKESQVNVSQIMSELKWHDVQNLDITANHIVRNDQCITRKTP